MAAVSRAVPADKQDRADKYEHEKSKQRDATGGAQVHLHPAVIAGRHQTLHSFSAGTF
jgi:hypothetical protein